jgi:hypothetical protein
VPKPTCGISKGAANRAFGGYLAMVSGLTTLRNLSRKSCASGLNVLFFKVTIPTGRRVLGNSTGSVVRDGCLPGSRAK